MIKYILKDVAILLMGRYRSGGAERRRGRPMQISNNTYPTPVVRFDALAQVVVVEHRDPATGEESYQVPTEATLRSEDEAALAGRSSSSAGGAATAGTRLSLVV